MSENSNTKNSPTAVNRAHQERKEAIDSVPPENSFANPQFGRRNFLETAFATFAIAPLLTVPLQFGTLGSEPLTKEQRDA